MVSRIKELSIYRLHKAEEDLEAARLLLQQALYKVSLNRSYYAVFHAMRSVTILEEFDSSKHSGVIAYFNQHFVKTGIFDKSASKVIKSAFMLREKSDYEDFYIASKKEAEEQLEKAAFFVSMVKDYLSRKDILE